MNVQKSKLKHIKKVTGIILILAMLLLPFTSLLNVKAEATEITVDSNATKSDDPNSKKVTNTTKLTVRDGKDLLKAYKVLDIYYNATTNEMSYDFTTTFTNFKSSSYATTTTKDFSTLTVNEYLAYGEEGANQAEFNLLAAQFARYIRKNDIAGLEFTSDTEPTAENDIYIYRDNIEAGAYLILPITNNTFIDKEGIKLVNTYGALIANVVFTADSSGGWSLYEHYCSAKVDDNGLSTMILDCEPSKVIDFINSEEDLLDISSFYKNREYSYLLYLSNQSESEYVTDASSWKTVITLPDGIGYGDIYSYAWDDATEETKMYPVANNKLYNGDQAIADITVSGKTITITSPTRAFEDPALVIGVKLSDNPVLGEAGNTIKAEATFVTDPYSDPTGTTTLTAENKIITYGLQITNKNTAGDTVLDGGVFGIYTDSTCSDSSKIGEVTVEHIVGNFEGVTEGDLYVKQIKAPSGYKLSTDVAHVTIDTTALTTEGYYPLEVKNAKAGFLPSTGGLGTVIYTLVGLLVIGVGSYAVIRYSKKQANS